ncbi:hypothetical protein [Paraflavitalea speifideaquila]|uniref:hypothetical protein n=1 Tax=Paraflavitalea speifideaquila TaxID=3076558 RepID=UPI0028E43C71|nr:hypothetical protein [Paraflavitalea speifideiaquila]
MLAACSGPAEQATVIANKDSAKTAIDTSDITYDELPPGSIKADSYWGRMGLEELLPALMAFVPTGYQVMDTCSGDLNLDTYPDYLLVLNVPQEDIVATKRADSAGPLKRSMLVLLGQQDSTYKLAVQSDKAIYCSDCGGGGMGDPYSALVIKNGYFSIEHYGGGARRWTRTTTFKYSATDSTWYLHKDGHVKFNAGDEEDEKEQ